MLTARRAFLALLAALALLLAPMVPAQATPVTTGVLSGTVVGPDGEPVTVIPGTQYAWVSVQPLNSVANVVDSAIADATGAFVFPSVPAGDYHLTVRYLGPSNLIGSWAPGVFYKTQAQVFTVTAGQTLDVDLEIQQGASISGRLTASGGTAGGYVSLTQSDGPPWAGIDQHRMTMNSSTGDYTVDRIVPGTYGVSYYKDFTRFWGVQWPNRWGGVGEATPISLASGEARTGMDVELPPISTVAGTLSFSAGAPTFTGGTVNLFQNGQWINSDSVGPDGRFLFTGMTGDGLAVCLQAPQTVGYIGESCWHPTLGSVRERETFSMQRTDRYVDIDLRAASGGLLLFDTRSRSESGEYQGWFDGEVTLYKLDEADGYWYPTRTIPSGDPPYYDDRSYIIGALEPGDYRIQVTSPGNFSWFGRLYYPGTREWAEADTITISEFTTTDLGTMPITWKEYDSRRIAGVSRYETGVEISRETLVEPPVPVVYIASGESYPDALSAGPAAAALGGVLLLTPPTGLTDALRTELGRLDPDRIVVVGGVGSVPRAVELALRDYVDSADRVSRIGGADRYETSRRIVADAFDGATGRVAFIATGANFPDALAAGPAAASFAGPVLLVKGDAASLDSASRALLDTLEPAAFVLAGGTGSISGGIESSLRSRYGALADVIRAPGADRYETATLINMISFSEAETALYASGAGFADALAGGTLAASLQAPLYLVSKTCVPNYVRTHIDELGVFSIRVLGGTGVVSDAVLEGALCSP